MNKKIHEKEQFSKNQNKSNWPWQKQKELQKTEMNKGSYQQNQEDWIDSRPAWDL